MTIQEYINSHKVDKVWLCPNLVEHASFNETTSGLLRGIECSINSIPESLLDKEITKHWKEDKITCLIWRNVSFDKEPII